MSLFDVFSSHDATSTTTAVTNTDSYNSATNWTSTTDNAGNVTLNLGDSASPSAGSNQTGMVQLIVAAVVVLAAIFILKNRT